MPAAPWPDPRSDDLAEMLTFIRRTSTMVADAHQHMLRSEPLLEDDINHYWFLTHANDSWRLDQANLGLYIRARTHKLFDWDTDFFNDRSQITDATQFIVRAMIWTCWDGVKIGLNRDEKQLLLDYRQNYLEKAVEALICTGKLTYHVIGKLNIIGLIPTSQMSLLYGIAGPAKIRQRLAETVADWRFPTKQPELDAYDAAWQDHFQNSWLPTLLPADEYTATKDLSIVILRELYIDIWENGPDRMHKAYQASIPPAPTY